MIPKIIRWLKIDFSLLCKPRYNYEKQERIDPYCVEMASAAMVHFGLDPGKSSDGWGANTRVITAMSKQP